MKTYTSPKEAIGRSISHNEIVTLLSTDPKESLALINNDENVAELDWTLENSGEMDVWGISLEKEFRIRIREELKDGKLVAGRKYAQCNLEFRHWIDSKVGPEPLDDSHTEGYNVSDYFERDGTYKGSDEYGVEPIFTLA